MAASQKPRRKYSPSRQKHTGGRVSVNQLRQLFHPVVKLLREIQSDAVTSIRGVPQVNFGDHYEDAASFLVGWCAFYLRVRDRSGMAFNLEPLARLAPKLDHGVPIHPFEVCNAEQAVNDCFLAIQKVPSDLLRDCALTEQIALEIYAA